MQLIEGLQNIRSKVARKVLRSAILKGCKEIARVAISKAPVGETGLLHTSIKAIVTKMVSGKVYTDPKVVGPNGEKPAKYAHLVEFGSVHNKAKPFMRTAMDESKNRVMRMIQEEAKRNLDKMESGGVWR